MTALVLALCAPASAGAACNDTTFSVRTGPLSGPSKVAGTLCRRPTRATTSTLLITAHGATYNRLYWDWPQDPGTYSFVRNMAGDASILNVDLLGSGKSSRPLSVLVSQQAQAAVLHQLVQTMRARGFRRVILVGHSSGSGAVTLEAATYHDVDGVVVTGFTHRLALKGLAVPLSMYPATLDPAFAAPRPRPRIPDNPPRDAQQERLLQHRRRRPERDRLRRITQGRRQRALRGGVPPDHPRPEHLQEGRRARALARRQLRLRVLRHPRMSSGSRRGGRLEPGGPARAPRDRERGA